MKEKKYCIDCKHSSIGNGLTAGYAFCFHPDYLNEIHKGGEFCEWMRKNACKDWVLFEQKQKTKSWFFTLFKK